MLRDCTCINGAVVVGLIATLTPGVWAPSVQQEARTVTGARLAGSVPVRTQQAPPASESRLSDMTASAQRLDVQPGR